MLDRVNNPNNKRYKDYGMRGIDICKAWAEDVWSFIHWAEANGYEKGLSIDRRDNGKGYHPNNCRWENNETQAQNRQVLSVTNTSGYRGVSWNKARKKWTAEIRYNHKRKHLGRFDDKDSAANAYDAFIIENGLASVTNRSLKRKD